jgi:hypothetical protein
MPHIRGSCGPIDRRFDHVAVRMVGNGNLVKSSPGLACGISPDPWPRCRGRGGTARRRQIIDAVISLSTANRKWATRARRSLKFCATQQQRPSDARRYGVLCVPWSMCFGIVIRPRIEPGCNDLLDDRGERTSPSGKNHTFPNSACRPSGVGFDTRTNTAPRLSAPGGITARAATKAARGHSRFVLPTSRGRPRGRAGSSCLLAAQH